MKKVRLAHNNFSKTKLYDLDSEGIAKTNRGVPNVLGGMKNKFYDQKILLNVKRRGKVRSGLLETIRIGKDGAAIGTGVSSVSNRPTR